MDKKGLVLSFDSRLSLILIATFRPYSAGDIVDLLSRTICTTVVVSEPRGCH